MRVIAGTLKGRRLVSPEPGDLRIRPTADRAREALFSILQQWPQGAFLELFGGTGAVSVEACSRGYGPVTCVESASVAFPLLEANTRGTGIKVLRKDVRRLVPGQFEGLAVLFADPPYEAAADLWQELAPRLRGWMESHGILVWETDAKTDLQPVQGWEEADTRRYGAASFHFLRPV